MSLRFKAGDLVLVDGEDEGQVLSVDIHQPGLPYYIATKRGATYFHPCRVAPRVTEAKPTTWRLPEPGDTIKIIADDDDDSTLIGKEREITKVDWNDAWPIWVEKGHTFRLNQVQFVRLRDTPEPTPVPDPIESAVAAMATEPTSKPSEPEPTQVSAPTAESDLKLLKHPLETAIRLLTHSALDHRNVLGDGFARDAIRAALPLIKAAYNLAAQVTD